jgi:hypothetical protein
VKDGGSVVSAATVTRMVTVALWAAIAAGPALGVAALINSDSPPTKVGSGVATVRRSAFGPGDFAIRYVIVWLEQSDGDGEALRAFYPEVPAPSPDRAGSACGARAAIGGRQGSTAGVLVGHGGRTGRRARRQGLATHAGPVLAGWRSGAG